MITSKSTAISNAISLESVAQQFEHWRATREKRSKIPDTLLALVISLMNQYSHKEITSALKINFSQLKKRMPSLSHHPQKDTTFVEFPLPTLSSSTENCTMEFTCKNGTAVKISGLIQAQMQPLISLLVGN
jgi:hypothetical protein